MLKKLALMVVAFAVLLAGGTYVAFQVSPWPSALLIRWAFQKDGAKTSEALRKHVPQGISEHIDIRYDSGADGRLDVFYPSSLESAATLPVVVWVHGGAWIAGSKEQIANYLRILADKGFVTIGVDYTIAPAAQYPTPVVQVNKALAFVAANAGQYHIDPTRFILAGDSAGAQIAAQTALVISAPSYAAEVGIQPAITRAQLRGVVLHCGGYDAESVNFDGAFGGFLRTVFWSYFGSKDFRNDPRIQQFSIVANMTKAFPPAFISAGNADPLEPQSRLLAQKASSLGITIDRLFFAKGHQPPLPHEYQFNLDSAAGRQAFDRSVAFMKGLP